MADNFHFDMTGVVLTDALRIAFGDHKKAIGWADLPVDKNDLGGPGTPGRRLVLFWSNHDWMTALPAPMSAEDVEPFVKAWLSNANYGRQPDHDGDNHKGWRVYNEAWGHAAGRWEAFVAIEPAWLMYGK